MNKAKIFIDANLLILLVAGNTDRKLIGKHRRLKDFTETDYDLLLRVMNSVKAVLVTPNTLTEASNLLAQHRDPEKTALFKKFKFLIDHAEEFQIPSRTAIRNDAFDRLGLTDTVLLETVSSECPLLTFDLDLYLAVSNNQHDAAFNFNHFRSSKFDSHNTLTA